MAGEVRSQKASTRRAQVGACTDKAKYPSGLASRQGVIGERPTHGRRQGSRHINPNVNERVGPFSAPMCEPPEESKAEREEQKRADDEQFQPHPARQADVYRREDAYRQRRGDNSMG